MVTIAELSVFGAVLLYLFTVAPVKAVGRREFDNADPRAPAFYELPLRKRALGAHQNGIETFPFFAAAVLLAEFRSCPQNWIDGLAMGFLIVRLAYIIAYLANRPTIRTLFWNLAFLINAAIFFLPAFVHR